MHLAGRTHLSLRRLRAIRVGGASLHGKQWIKFDEGRAAQAAGLGSLPSADELDPDQYLTYLRAASGGLTSTGNQVIDAVATSGYRGEFELQRAARLAPRDRRAATIAAVGNLEHITGVHAIPFQVWIDGRHRVRRMSVAEGESSSQAYAVKIFITVDFVRFGEEPRTPGAAVRPDARCELGSRAGAEGAAARRELIGTRRGARAELARSEGRSLRALKSRNLRAQSRSFCYGLQAKLSI